MVLWLLVTAQYPEVIANRARWPKLGIQPQNLHEHETRLIAEATVLLALNTGQRQKLPDQIFESFVTFWCSDMSNLAINL
jgi:hypothetical protein